MKKSLTIPPQSDVEATPINPAGVTNGPPTSVVHIIFHVHNVVAVSSQGILVQFAIVLVLRNLKTVFGSLSEVIGPHPAT